MAEKKRGMMFVLSSPSGVGKTTLTKKIEKNNPGFIISISHTTRTPRLNEINGKDYHFVTKEKFNHLIKNNNFFEYAKIFDNYYGTLRESILESVSSVSSVFLIASLNDSVIFTLSAIPVALSKGLNVIVGASTSAVVKLRVVESEIPAYELLELSSNAVAAIWT